MSSSSATLACLSPAISRSSSPASAFFEYGADMHQDIDIFYASAIDMYQHILSAYSRSSSLMVT